MLTRDRLLELNKLLPGQVSTSLEVLQRYSNSLFYTNSPLPFAVCYAESADDVIKVTDFCIQYKIPLIPYGSGTSVEGHTSAIYGGICLDLSKMNRVLDFKPDDDYVIVQPGISYNQLNDYLDKQGFHFPVEAGWGASIGGMVATNASGAGATDAGSMAKNVIDCEAIVYEESRAKKIKTGTKSRKSSSGYNLTSLLVGSEGTLGVITEITLKVRKNFATHNTICCQFNKIQDAITFVIAMKGRVQFRRVELLDKLQTNACLAYSYIDYLQPEKNTVILELAGNEHAVSGDVMLIKNFLLINNGEHIKIFCSKKEAEEIWMMRKNACQAAIQWIDKNKKAMATDISVPLSRLNYCIEACYEHMQRLGLKAPLVAHIGDGNFHFTLLINPEDKKELEKAFTFNQCIVEEALKCGGTCTGEHGIGIGKKQYLAAEHADSLFVLRRLKKAMDPLGIFNPGKVIDENLLPEDKAVHQKSVSSIARSKI